MSNEQSLTIDTSEMNVLFVHSAIDDYPLSVEEFRVYSHIARRAGAGEAWPKVESIAKKCKIHPDTARRCLQNLIEYGLLSATERKGKTTLYRITRPSVWKKPEVAIAIQQAQADTKKAKREAKKAAKEQEKQNPSLQTQGVETPPSEHNPSETEGGYPSGLEGGHPSETKGDEVNPLKFPPEGNPSSSEEAGQPDHVPPPPDDDELSAVAAKTQNPTPKAPDRPAQVETQGQGGQARPAPDLENVPAAGGAAASAILALRAISLAELDQREARDPTTNKTLRALMQASDKSRLTHLQEQLALTTQGPRSIPRHYLTRLTDEEIEQARVAAQTDAKTIKGGMGRAGYYALDALIGEQYTLERLTGYPQNTGRSSEQPVHRSHQALNSGKVAPAPSSELETPLPDYLPGAMWRHKKSGEAVLIKEKDGIDVVLTSGARLFMGELVLNYKLEVPGSLPTEASA